jgi:type II secretory pathway pseudopilin PulG
LAAIVVVAYNGIQERARETKIAADLAQIERAILLARINTGQTLIDITGNGWTGEGCMTAINGRDLTDTSDTNVANCQTAWENFLNTVSEASGANIRNITDPWGRPYYVDENEGQNGGSCTPDDLGRYFEPHQQWGNTNLRTIPNSLQSCL